MEGNEIERLLNELRAEAAAIPDDEIQSPDIEASPNDSELGELDDTERKVYTLIGRMIDEMNDLLGKTRESRKNGQMDDGLHARYKHEFASLFERQALLNDFLNNRIHLRLDIEGDVTFGIRQEWKIVKVTR
ncbi:MAG: hypothetical protein U9Q03_03410 [Patescibacteria group bacterium]|nr:hypothetical protein [Patescibacteria group bacterium]